MTLKNTVIARRLSNRRSNPESGSPRLLRALAMTIFLLSFSSALHAQTPITDEMREAFFQDCFRLDNNQEMSTNTQKALCQCTSHHMQDNLSVEDVQTMRGQDQAARDALNKMLLEVYAPCMEFPVRDLIYKRCMQNDIQSKKGICGCLAEKMSVYTAQTARATLGDILKTNPNITDPMDPIVNSASFERMEKQVALECIQGR